MKVLQIPSYKLHGCFIYLFFVREGLLVPLIGLPEQVSGNLDHGFTDLILVDTACVEAELYNLHFCSFISVGQRTNEVSLSSLQCHFYLFLRGKSTVG